jgi:regulation of enolase protein 1 (concanavalin A-like superfamily)
MDTKLVKSTFVRAMYSMVILALVFSVTGSAYAQEPVPWLIAFPENNAVEGWEWPEGATVYLTIDNAPEDFIREGIAEVTSWGDPRTYVRFDFWEDYDLQAGDVVTLTDEFGTIATHTVQNLMVTEVNADSDTVAGAADVEAVVQVWPHGFDQDFFIEDTAEDGTWFADFGALGFHVIEETGGRSQIVVDGNATAVDWNAPPPAPWRDEFEGLLADGWYWVNENPNEWNLTENPGSLRIYASPFVTGDENLLLRPVAPGDFMIKTRVLFEPDTNFQFAGLVIWQDENNFLQLGRAFCDIEEICVGNGIYFDKILGGGWMDGNFATQFDNPFNPADSYLRLERRGDMVRAFYSHEGITWTEIGTHWIPPDFQVNGVGLTASQDYSDLNIPADFDFFELTEGWGFLPEGFHDYDGGDVPDWACGAGGWAADPDDRAADLAIEVNVDGTSLPEWLYASEYREDLDQAGVCVDGKCSFSTSLWGMISSYEPHSVVVYAQDIPSGEWVQLSNSPKTLTCRTYDIYAYDKVTGGIKQITNLRESDEYNPTWSPNAKFIAHDVVTGDSHDIYITHVATGKSLPLKGADSGNDAAWSPNGLWIAFDRRWAGDESIYVVPFTGGHRRLVRGNAVSPDWSPNGLRIVFQDPADGGKLKTVGLLGDLVIGVAEYGESPSWSPDGKWIAYQRDGDIWKVRVGLLGAPLAEPIQVTSGPFDDGGPTWSADSKYIIYASGFGMDYDLWKVPAAGGMPIWLNGSPEFGDYDPDHAGNSPKIAYESFSPEGQAVRSWVAAYSYDLPIGTLTDGTYPYHFDFEWTLPEPGVFSGQGGEFVVSNEAPIYDGNILLRGPAELRGVDTPEGLVCETVGEINPDQPARFLIGWLYGYDVFIPMTYAEARAHFDSITARAVWGDEMSAPLARHEIFPWTSQLDWPAYVCTYTR